MRGWRGKQVVLEDRGGRFGKRTKILYRDGTMSAERVIDFERGGLESAQRERAGAEFRGDRRKPSQRVTVAPEDKLLVSREEAAQLLSISQRALDYLVSTRRLPIRRIGGRVLIPMADLRRYACSDHPERIVS
jgi:excisionase family DNA binding protein